MEKLVLILHVVACVLLVLLVLLQSGKEGMGVIFGGGSTSMFGATGAGGILVKLTTFIAVIFLCTSLGYNLITSSKFKQDSSIIELAPKDPFGPDTEKPDAVQVPQASPAAQ